MGSGQTAASRPALGRRLLWGLVPLVLQQEGADDRQVPVQHLLCWRTRGQRRLLLRERTGMPELESSCRVPALGREWGWWEPCGLECVGSHGVVPAAITGIPGAPCWLLALRHSHKGAP